MNSRHILFSLALLTGIVFTIKAQAPTSHYSPINKIKVEGDGGWDYLASDDASGLIYLSHGNIVQVLDPKTGLLKATIPETKGVHGIAIADDLGKGFISNGRDTSVTIFDLKTFKTITKVKVTGKNPDAILYDPFSKKVFAYNGRTSNATVIDAVSNKVVATIPLKGKPEFSATDNKGKVYVNIEDSNAVSVINTTTLKVENTWSVAPGEEPSGLALDNKNHRLFMVCGNNVMMILNAENGKVIAKLPIGDGSDGVAFDAGKERAYSSNGDGTMTVVQGTNGGDYKILETVKTQKGARTITVNEQTHKIYMPTAEFDELPAGEKEKKRPPLKKGSFTVLEISTLK
jgi:YVTN family beta-propeller protein